MRGIFGLIGSTAGGWLGWWLGDYVGITTAVMLSAIGTGAGLYAARRFIDHFLR
jgi:uncharacterized membrane protein